MRLRAKFLRLTEFDVAVIFGALLGLLLSLPVGGPLN